MTNGPLRRTARVRTALTLAIAVAAILAVWALSLLGRPAAGVSFDGDLRVGGTLERLTLPALEDGRTVDYARFEDRPLVLNFFASWCPFCIAEMPAFEEVYRRLDGRVGFLGVSQSDARGASIELVRASGITYPTGYDRRGDFFAAIGSLGMPTTVLIRAGGEIAYIHVGPLDAANLIGLIEEHLGVPA
jgi:thiol-disulfide isomerase/thioredoxin